MNSVQTTIERMGSNFLVASMIPALAFVTSVVFIADPVLPPGIRNRFGGEFDLLGTPGLIILIITIILGFTLTTLNIFLIKIFEGYILIWRIPFFKNSQLRAHKKYKQRIKMINWRIDVIKNSSLVNKGKILFELNVQRKKLETAFQNEFPTRQDEVLPTRFGNVYRSSEVYPMLRYKIDAVPLWPRLIHSIPPSYTAHIEQAHNELSFLVNCALLSLLFAMISLVISFYQLFLAYYATSHPDGSTFLYLIPISLPQEIYLSRFVLYLLAAIAGAVITILFSRASLLSVSEFGYMIRSAFDLFRFDLLKQLHLELPNDSDEEVELWNKISRFINVGYSLDQSLQQQRRTPVFTFVHNPPSNQGETPHKE